MGVMGVARVAVLLVFVGCRFDLPDFDYCGDKEINPGEACDDGNAIDDDGCSADCASNEACGNGYLDVDEACDDSNLSSGDGCSADCRHEICGDSFYDPAFGEECDFGNQNSDTGTCTTMCQLAKCGDGYLYDAFEECDDGIQNSNSDACTTMCKIARCGDGHLYIGFEECDFGSENSNDGVCTTMCRNAICGDGFVMAGIEQCDDGNISNCGTCNSICSASQSGGNCPAGMGCVLNADCASGVCRPTKVCQ